MSTLRQRKADVFLNYLGLTLALTMCLTNLVQAQTLGHVRAFADALTFPFPVEMLPANDGTGRMFVVSQNGIISVFPNVPTTSSAQVFLNIGPSGSNNRIVFSSGEERGLLGMALHPDFRNNRQFFLYYTTLNAGITRMVLARYFVDPNNANQALLTEERLLVFDKNQNNSNHNGGKIAFGPDGFLYLSIGDGGGGGDPQNNAQNRNVLFGKMLRIDVNGDDFPADASRNYRIPASNPFASSGGSPEIFAWGLRNTWKFSFDRVTGLIWGGDVGQGNREEINLVTRGGNFGWRKYEGNITYNAGDPIPSAPAATFPVFDYNSSGASITGGYVYRGTAIPDLEGRYVYGDYVRGTIASLAFDGATATNTNHYVATDGATTINIASFGEDERGELYFIGRNTSRIYRLTSTANAPSGQAVQGFGKWAALATGTNGVVRAIITDAIDNVYVAGSFNTAGGVPANNIARWNPNTGWAALGTGLSGTVSALAFRGSDLIVGGAFANAGNASANNVAVWNGTSWAALGTGVDGPVRALAVNGSDVFVGGAFASPSNNVARWNGTAWSGLDVGTNNEIRSMVYDAARQALLVGGNFSLAGTTSAASVASWSSVNGWQALGSGLGGFVNALALLPNGDLVAGGSFTTAGGNNFNRIARWNGTVWSGFAGGIGATVNALAVSRGRLLAGGLFALADGRVVNNVALWDSAAGGWNALGPGTAVGVDAGVNALAVVGNFAFAGGGQINAGALTVNNIARLELPIIWNNGWTPAAPIAGENVAIMSTNPTQPGNFVCNDLTVNSGAVLSLGSGQAITVSGALDYSGATIEVLTGGSFVQASTSIAVTTTSTSRFRVVRTDGRNAIGYNLISSPVSGETINSIGLNTYPNNRFRYSPVPVAGQTWVSLAGTAPLVRGVGYTYIPAQGSNNTITFENTNDGLVGQPGNGNVNVPLTFAGNNFNLIGNPYPSPINLLSFLTANASVISGTAWFWQDNNNGTGTGTYVAHNLVTPPIQVAVGQGFFVLASASGNVAFTNNLRASGTPTFYRTEGDMERFRLGVSSASGADELWVAFAPHFTTGFEKGFDAQKFEGSTSLSLAAVVGNERLAIAALPNDDGFELPLALFVRQAGEYHFIAREVENPAKQKLFLEDRQTGEFYYLQTGRSHPLNLQAGHYRDRFYLRSAAEVAGQVFLTGETAGAYAFGRDLFVETSETAEVMLYNMLGTELLRFGQVPAGGLRRLAANVPASGVYVVKVATASGSVEKRVWLEK